MEKIVIGDFFIYKKQYLPTDLVKCILKLYWDKTTLKDVKGKELEYFKSKENINSCYGMCVTSIIKEWEDGFDSITGRFYADQGKDLSGGQWQLVGLARAYFKESSHLNRMSFSLIDSVDKPVDNQLTRVLSEKHPVVNYRNNLQYVLLLF